MDDLTNMKKYLVAAKFEWSDKMMEHITEHRELMNQLIEDQVIEHYVVSMEVETVWITMNCKSKVAVRKYLSKSPLYKFWKLQINELLVWDGFSYRLPALQLN